MSRMTDGLYTVYLLDDFWHVVVPVDASIVNNRDYIPEMKKNSPFFRNSVRLHWGHVHSRKRKNYIPLLLLEEE